MVTMIYFKPKLKYNHIVEFLVIIERLGIFVSSGWGLSFSSVSVSVSYNFKIPQHTTPNEKIKYN